MKRGKYEKMPPAAPGKKPLILVICIVLLLALGVGGTLAMLSKSANPVINTFVAGSVKAEVIENFNSDKTAKTSILVKNTGNSPVYVRVRLVSYYMENGSIAPKASPAISFTLGDNWTHKDDGYYYYTKPLAGDNATTDNLLGSSVPMDVGQVIDVMAETVQATPAQAVVAVWGVEASSFIAG